eukprot:1994280-Amphidinium_carterae.1
MESTPLFPDSERKTCTKTNIIRTLQMLASLDGSDIKGVTGHSLRVTGAQHMARHRLPLPLIQLHARWVSQVVMHYVAEAPLHSLTDTY